ncbi:MAG: uracil-DNA glycosylase family protein [Phycisphaerales bacterium JB063]
MPTADTILAAAKTLCKTLDRLRFAEPVTHVYNPYDYAYPMHEQYVRRYGDSSKHVVFLGMNPGPWGMAQTGAPFGEVAAVRDYLKLDAPIGKPRNEHPKRPIEGLACNRSEVSGRRLWGLLAERYPNAEDFFNGTGSGGGGFILNYCPLVFMEQGGKNRTPDKLPAGEREPLEAACDTHLRVVVEALAPEWVVGVGAFAEKQAKRVLDGMDVNFGRVLHPSPASPIANRGWAPQAEKQLIEMGVWDGGE